MNGCIITSTADIAKRAGVDDMFNDAAEVPMNIYTTFNEDGDMLIENPDIKDAVDYQHVIR
jgi:hypothetical protein